VRSALGNSPQANWSHMNVEAEKAILGLILMENSSYFEVTEQLSIGDFGLDSHRKIFGSIAGLLEDRQHVDIITLSNKLRETRELETIGGVAYLSGLTDGIPRHFDPKNYVDIVLKKSQLRKVVSICDRIGVRAMDGAETPDQLLAEMQSEALDISADAPGEMQRASAILPKVLVEIEEQRKIDRSQKTVGFTTGVPGLDERTCGLYPNEYTIISGDTGGGKTAFATQISLANLRKDIPVLWFSLEMTKEQLIRRCFAPMSEFLRAKDIRDPRSLNVTDYLELKNVSKKLAELPLWVDDNSRLSLDKILARARLAIARYGVRIIVLDYLQIVEVPDVKDDVQRLDRVTYRLRDLAKTEKGVHVIALSQHSYGEDSKGKKRLKGSSSLMQSCQNLFELRTEEESSDAEIAIRKQREGRRGRVSCRYDADSLSFVA